VKRLVVTLLLALAALLISTTSAFAATWHVWPGGSIQRAIRHASPGDTIIVHRGVYHESLTIRKSRLTIIGRHATLRQPAHPRGLCAQAAAPEVNGICVLGGIDFQTGAPIGAPVRGTTIRGLRIVGFHGDGLFMIHVADSRIEHVKALRNTGYGIAGFIQHGGAYLWNVARNNGEPGFYLGDSPDADYVIAHNSASGNQYGIFIRHSAHGLVHDNTMWGNCIGAFLLDDGETGGLHDMIMWDNTATANTKACAADDEGAPPLSGIGVLLFGARHTVLHDNTITNNVPSGDSIVSGGVVLVSAKPFGGSPVRNDHIRHNVITGNQAFDIFWDGSGFNNTFTGNTCATSQPGSICS
jgi:nitrous oxidase accessory protein NosD